MANTPFDIKPILFRPKFAEAPPEFTNGTLLKSHFAALAHAFDHTAAEVAHDLGVIGDFLVVASSLDEQFGADATLPVVDIADAADAALQSLAAVDARLDQQRLAEQRQTLHTLAIGIGYWCMRHQLAISSPGLIVNALATQSNAATSRQETAAIFALMQGFVAHLQPGLQADLERSNPERPWRILNLNFAITAIRSGDPTMIRFAFDTLNRHLPDERAGFYAEAVMLSSQPDFPEDTRRLIEAEVSRWTKVH